MFAVITRSDQKFKEPPPTPSRGLAMRDKFWSMTKIYLSYISSPPWGGVRGGESDQLAFN